MNRWCIQILSNVHRASKCDKLSPIALAVYPVQLKYYKKLAFLQFNKLKFRASIQLSHYLQTRNCSSGTPNDENKKKPPVLMNFVPIMRPELLRSIKNWILTKFIIQPYLDSNFTLKDFTQGAKQALVAVSSYLSEGDFKSLEGLVTDDAISEIKKNFSALNMKERQDLLMKLSDIIFAFPYQIGIIFDDSNQRRFAEITVVYHCMNDLEDLKAQGKLSTEDVTKDIKICNYRFIREYTKGVESDWIINRLGHFKVCHFNN